MNYSHQQVNKQFERQSVTVKKVPYQQPEENQKLSLSGFHPKAENDMWKTKYENQLSQLVQLKSYYELEIKNLSQELSHFRLQTQETQWIAKNQSQSDENSLKNLQDNIVISELKKSQYQQQESYDNQSKRFRDQLEDQSALVNDLYFKLDRAKQDEDTLVQRHKNEIDQLHCKLSQFDRTHQEQINQMKQKYDFYAQNSHKTQKEANETQIELLTEEIMKIKQIMNIKNVEIETLIQQNQLQKIQNESEQDGFKSEILNLKKDLQIYDQAIFQSKMDLQNALERQHSQQLLSYKMQHQQQLSNSHNEILNLKNIIETRKQEVENLQVQRVQQKSQQEDEIQKILREQDFQKQRAEIRDQERLREIADFHMRNERMVQNHQENEKQLSGQMMNREKEIKTLKEMLNQCNQDILDCNNQLIFKCQSYEISIAQLKDEIETLRLRWIESDKDKDFQYDELKLRFTQIEITFEDKMQINDKNQDVLQELVWKVFYMIQYQLQDQLQYKIREQDQIQHQNYLLEHEMSRNKDEKDKLLDKLNQISEEREIYLEDQRFKNENANAFQMDSVKAAYNTQISIMQSEITDLRQLIAQKQRDYVSLLENQQCLDKSKSRLDLSSTSKAISDTVLKCRNLSYNKK